MCGGGRLRNSGRTAGRLTGSSCGCVTSGRSGGDGPSRSGGSSRTGRGGLSRGRRRRRRGDRYGSEVVLLAVRARIDNRCALGRIKVQQDSESDEGHHHQQGGPTDREQPVDGDRHVPHQFAVLQVRIGVDRRGRSAAWLTRQALGGVASCTRLTRQTLGGIAGARVAVLVFSGVVARAAHVAVVSMDGEKMSAARRALAARSRISRPTSNWRPGRVLAIRRSCT